MDNYHPAKTSDPIIALFAKPKHKLERPQHYSSSFEIRSFRPSLRSSSSTARPRSKSVICHPTLPEGKLVRLTSEALQRVQEAGQYRKSVFDFVKQPWATSSFSERVQLRRYAGRVLVRGSVGQESVAGFGEACSTCRSRRKIPTAAAKA